VDQPVFLAGGRFMRTFGAADRLEALKEHQPADDAKKDHVAQLDQQIDLTHFA